MAFVTTTGAVISTRKNQAVNRCKTSPTMVLGVSRSDAVKIAAASVAAGLIGIVSPLSAHATTDADVSLLKNSIKELNYEAELAATGPNAIPTRFDKKPVVSNSNTSIAANMDELERRYETDYQALIDSELSEAARVRALFLKN